MEARMKNQTQLIQDATDAIQGLFKATMKGGVDGATLELIHLRASQINGCSFCVEMGARGAKKRGEADERLATVAAWREAPYFSDEERAALALTEAVTRLADTTGVPDEIWGAAADHFDEQQLAAITLMIATTNMVNRVNVTVRQPAGAGW